MLVFPMIRTRSLIAILSICTLVTCGTISSTTKTEPALLIVSYDAFRPEYFNRSVTPIMNKFRKDGVSAPFVFNVFPTKTFVNHHTIATVSKLIFGILLMIIYNMFIFIYYQGLYPETHGVLANEIYDTDFGKLGYSYELFHYDENILPIWVSSQNP